MATTPWTPAEDDRFRAPHDTETPVRKIAETLGRPRSTVAYRLKRLGLTSTRTKTAAATAANVADAKARRARLQLELLDDAERLRGQMFAPTKVFNFGGKDNTYAEANLTEPTFTDKLKVMQAVGIAVDRHIRLDEHDTGTGATAAASMLDRLAAAMGVPQAPDLDGTETSPEP